MTEWITEQAASLRWGLNPERIPQWRRRGIAPEHKIDRPDEARTGRAVVMYRANELAAVVEEARKRDVYERELLASRLWMTRAQACYHIHERRLMRLGESGAIRRVKAGDHKTARVFYFAEDVEREARK